MNLIEKGKVKRIRGVSYASKVSIQNLNRMVSKVRDIFNDYIPDVWIFTDYYKGESGGGSPGYGISLVAESNSNCLISAEENYDLAESKEANLPENLGEKCALRLLDEIYYVHYSIFCSKFR